jgi:hypothetical protein
VFASSSSADREEDDARESMPLAAGVLIVKAGTFGVLSVAESGEVGFVSLN